MLKEKNKALACYKLFLDVASDSSELFYKIGVIYFDKEQYEEASFYLQKAEEFSTDYRVEKITTLLRSMLIIEKEKEMITIFEKAVEKYGQLPFIWINYAELYAYNEDYNLALLILDRGYEQVKDFGQILLYRMANFHYLMGNKGQGGLLLIEALLMDKYFVSFFLDYDEETAALPEVIEIIKEFINK
jgi:tetratricopeptide (TPR) repeat protein